MDKRKFLKTASAATVLAAFGLTLESCSSDDEPAPGSPENIVEVDLNVEPFTALKAEGGWVLHPNFDILMVNTGVSISAFSSVCTHSGCARNWNFNGEFICTCHNSKFATDGTVTSGPASSSLRRISVQREGDILLLG